MFEKSKIQNLIKKIFSLESCAGKSTNNKTICDITLLFFQGEQDKLFLQITIIVTTFYFRFLLWKKIGFFKL